MLILAETKCEAEAQIACLKNLGFDGFAYVPSVGRSGGLAAVWKASLISVSVLRRDRQFLHFRCLFPGGSEFMLTAIYAILLANLKNVLWQELRCMSELITIPWCIIGDFNDVSSPSESSVGDSINFARLNRFQNRMLECQLSDLGFTGPRFTWRGPLMANSRRLFERLDRALANTHFLTAYSSSSVRTLARTKFSDHNPICLCFESDSTSNSRGRPFRFEAMWLTHSNYNDLLVEKWLPNVDINLALSSFQEVIGVWNKEVFDLVRKSKNSSFWRGCEAFRILQRTPIPLASVI
ncbi:hypothetical protein QN277_019586 [Acacia crassicarpa]|uniref:Endonuclease/exonuclease/phosphatase domain-containing protein n=1 Tax=Acacia crassicarpa TaxID=499986 RepID=A0AAE1MK68_9FABA|nr:hypothetical protein QN277_019586 [Acacia crassicarpa]